MNFLALLGWSSISGTEVLSRDQLRAEFDLDRVSASPAIFDATKLRWMAGEHIRAADVLDLAQRALPFLAAAGLPAEAARAATWVHAFRDGVACLSELPPKVQQLLHPGPMEPEAVAVLATDGARRLMAYLDEHLGAHADLDGAGFKALLQTAGKELGIKGKDLFMPARAALTGRTHGPELPLLFDALGLALARERVRSA